MGLTIYNGIYQEALGIYPTKNWDSIKKLWQSRSHDQIRWFQLLFLHQHRNRKTGKQKWGFNHSGVPPDMNGCCLVVIEKKIQHKRGLKSLHWHHRTGSEACPSNEDLVPKLYQPAINAKLRMLTCLSCRAVTFWGDEPWWLDVRWCENSQNLWKMKKVVVLAGVLSHRYNTKVI